MRQTASSNDHKVKILPYYRYVANPWDKVENFYNGSITPGDPLKSFMGRNSFNFRVAFFRPDKDDENHDDAWFTAECFDDAGNPDKSGEWLKAPPRYEDVPAEQVNPNYDENNRGTTNYLGFYYKKEFFGTEKGLEELNCWLDEEYEKYCAQKLDKIKTVF